MPTKIKRRETFAALPSQSVYALCDETLLQTYGVDISAYVACCHRHEVGVIQYRNKSGDRDTMRDRLEALRRRWHGPLIVNDAVDLAYLCDGVHLGQEDFTAIDADFSRATAWLRREIGDNRIIGLSTHNLDEIECANVLDIDYIGLGAYRASATKDDANVLSESLDALAAHSRHLVAAIGGVRFADRFVYAHFRAIGSALLQAC